MKEMVGPNIFNLGAQRRGFNPHRVRPNPRLVPVDAEDPARPLAIWPFGPSTRRCPARPPTAAGLLSLIRVTHKDYTEANAVRQSDETLRIMADKGFAVPA